VTSEVGTFRTCRGGLTMSASGGKTDIASLRGHRRFRKDIGALAALASRTAQTAKLKA
jgi:hypothetical protein